MKYFNRSKVVLNGVFFLFLIFSCNFAYAAGNKNTEIINLLEEMRIVSQSIPKTYFYIHEEIRVLQSKKDLKKYVGQLDKDIKLLTSKLKGDENRNMLLFLSFTRDELKDVLRDDYSEENGALMLDFGESVLEGATSIMTNVSKTGNMKKTMRLLIEDMVFDLERATKYYIAFQAGFNDYNNIVQMNTALENYEKGLRNLKNNKKFASLHEKEIKKMDKYWRVVKKFYAGVEKGDLPLIVLVSSQHMEKNLLKMLHTTKVNIAKK